MLIARLTPSYQIEMQLVGVVVWVLAVLFGAGGFGYDPADRVLLLRNIG